MRPELFLRYRRCINHLLTYLLTILAALLHGTPAAGVSQTLRPGTRNGITAVSQRVPPIFGWAAIMLGIGPHSSLFVFFVCLSLKYLTNG